MELLSFCLFIGLMVGAILFCFLLIIARGLIPALQPKKPDFLSNKYVEKIISVIAIIEIACFAYGYFVEPNLIEVTRLELHSRKIPAGKSFRIVQLSDLHIESEGLREEKTPTIVNLQNPDLIILTGDYLNSDTGKPYLARFLSKLKASDGIYAVPGNFDSHFKSDDIFEKLGIKMRYADKVNLTINGCPIALWLNGGLTPFPDKETYNICVFHRPDFIPEAAEMGYDLYLCGHTHGGQIRLPFYGAIITLSKHGKRFEMGHYKEENMDAYVNRGLGMEGGIIPRVRFLARPEIAVIEVKSKN